MTEDSVLAPFMGSKYSEIADMVIHDIVVRAYLAPRVEEFERAMGHLRPLMQNHPTRTVEQALELLRADLANNKPARRGRPSTKETQ